MSHVFALTTGIFPQLTYNVFRKVGARRNIFATANTIATPLYQCPMQLRCSFLQQKAFDGVTAHN